MRLFILAQDIQELEIGVVSERELKESVCVNASPEQYLGRIDQKLREWKIALDQIEGVYVVTGPGSFTASRVSITIVNALAFSKQIPVFAIENKKRLSLEALYNRVAKNQIKPDKFALPSYDRQPQITVSKK